LEQFHRANLTSVARHHGSGGSRAAQGEFVQHFPFLSELIPNMPLSLLGDAFLDDFALTARMEHCLKGRVDGGFGSDQSLPCGFAPAIQDPTVRLFLDELDGGHSAAQSGLERLRRKGPFPVGGRKTISSPLSGLQGFRVTFHRQAFLALSNGEQGL